MSSRTTNVDSYIVFRSDGFYVLSKPNGIATFPFAAAISSLFKGTGSEVIKPRILRPVHRLDVHTSGSLIVTSNPRLFERLKLAFREHKIKKEYIAVVEGILPKNEGRISLPLSVERSKKTRPHTRVDANGSQAITDYKVVQTYGRFSLVLLKPYTGRTHQLRVHMSHLGAPILGDPWYNPHTTEGESFMFLHAHRITVPSSVTLQDRVIATAPLPCHMQEKIRNMKVPDAFAYLEVSSPK
ncbi:MAG: RNA pseudouridine synthase [Alphaproteobacteria bacterium]|nr:RNA pseudouridine synthase [Alphaproteobacteria bacterium]